MSYTKSDLRELIKTAVKQAVKTVLKAEQIKSRPIAIQDGAGCVNAHMIVRVCEGETTVLRVELADGTVIENYVQTEPLCTCTDLLSES